MEGNGKLKETGAANVDLERRVAELEADLLSHARNLKAVGMASTVLWSALAIVVGIAASTLYSDWAEFREFVDGVEGYQKRTEAIEATQLQLQSTIDDLSPSAEKILADTQDQLQQVAVAKEEEFKARLTELVDLHVENIVFERLRVKALEVVDDAGGKMIGLTSDDDGGAISVFGNEFEGSQAFLGVSNDGGGFFEIRHDNSRSATIVGNDDSGVLSIYDKRGDYRGLALGTGGAGGNPGVWLYDAEGSTKVELTAERPGLFLYDDNGVLRLAARGGDEHQALSISGPEGESLIDMVRGRQGGSVWTYSSDRPPMASRGTVHIGTHDTNRYGGLWLLDSEGDVRASFTAGPVSPELELRAGAQQRIFELWADRDGQTVFQFSGSDGERFLKAEIDDEEGLAEFFDAASGVYVNSESVLWPRLPTE